MIDGIVEYTPKMLMNYGLTAGRVRDKSVDEMKEEIRRLSKQYLQENQHESGITGSDKKI